MIGLQVEEMIQSGVISGGMIPKVQACLRALDGVRRAHIIDGRVPHALVRELFTHGGVGTMITKAQEDDRMDKVDHARRSRQEHAVAGWLMQSACRKLHVTIRRYTSPIRR